MKNKILFILVISLVGSFWFSSFAFAGDCFRDPIYDSDWNAVVITGAFVRDVACMEGSVVKTTASLNSVVHVIAETDGWYKIELADGTVGWVGQWLVEPTERSFNKTEPVLTSQNVDSDSDDVYFGDMYDIHNHLYEKSIWNLFYDGVVNGYPDGSFKPDSTLNRAELLKIVMESIYDSDEFDGYSSACFSDIKAYEWYSKYVCYAKKIGIVSGYGDGTFKPASEITIAEALKITMVAFGLEQMKGDDFWYKYYVDTAKFFGFIPSDILDDYNIDGLEIFNKKITRGQMANLIDLIRSYDGGFDVPVEDF